MENTLSFQNFTSILELFAGYYLLLGTNPTFSDFFNVTGVFHNWQNAYKTLEPQIPHLETLLTRAHDSTKVNGNITLSKQLTDQFAVLLKKGKKLTRMHNRWQPFIHLHFHPDNTPTTTERDQKESIFFRFFKSYYVFFGAYAMAVLVLGGFCEAWQKFYHLNFLHILATVVLVFLIISVCSIRLIRLQSRFVVTVATFTGSAIVFALVCFLLPARFFVKIQFINYWWFDHSYQDVQILWGVFLIFFPVLVHLFTLMMVGYLCNRFTAIAGELLPWLPSVQQPVKIPTKLP